MPKLSGPDLASARTPRPIRQRRTDFNPVLAFKYELPGELMLEQGASKATLKLYALLVNLSRKTGHCDYSNPVLAEALEISERTISRAMVWLKDHCWIREGWMRQPTGWAERWIYPTKQADNHLKMYREKMGLKKAILPIVRSSRSRTKMSELSDNNGVSYKREYSGNCTEEEKNPKPHQEVGLPESISTGSMSQRVAPAEETDKPGTADASPRPENGSAYYKEGKNLVGAAWIAKIREKHQALANDLKALFPDFDWENSPAMARKFVKAVRRGALNTRAILLLKLYLREAHEERDEDGKAGQWRKPQTFQELTKRNVLDRTIQLCFEAAVRSRETGDGRLAQPGTISHKQEMDMYVSYFKNDNFADPEVCLTYGNMPAWVVAWGAHLQGIRYTLAQRQYLAENMLTTMHRSSINNVVELVKMTGQNITDMFFINEHEMLELQAHRQKLDDAKEEISRVVFGEEAL